MAREMESQENTLERFGRILERLFLGYVLDSHELAEEFSVSLRTIQRDLNERMKFLPIIKEGRKYRLERLADGYDYKVLRKFASLCGIQKLYPNLEDHFLQDLLNDKINHIFSVQGSFEQARYEKFNVLAVAILHNQRIRANYGEKRRILEPYKLFHKNGVWYVIAAEGEDSSVSSIESAAINSSTAPTRKIAQSTQITQLAQSTQPASMKLKSFALAKITQISILEDTFTPSVAFLHEIESKKIGFVSNAPIIAALEVKAQAKEYFFRKDIIQSLRILENHNPESFIVEGEFAYKDELFNLVRSWIPYITILEPQALQEELNTTLQAYINATHTKS